MSNSIWHSNKILPESVFDKIVFYVKTDEDEKEILYFGGFVNYDQLGHYAVVNVNKFFDEDDLYSRENGFEISDITRWAFRNDYIKEKKSQFDRIEKLQSKLDIATKALELNLSVIAYWASELNMSSDNTLGGKLYKLMDKQQEFIKTTLSQIKDIK